MSSPKKKKEVMHTVFFNYFKYMYHILKYQQTKTLNIKEEDKSKNHKRQGLRKINISYI